MRTIDIIKRPVISEKSTALAEVAGRYVFETESYATKPQIKKAVQELFNVKVKKVRTMNMQIQLKRTQKGYVKKPNWKKAIVTLEEGQKIEFFQTK